MGGGFNRAQQSGMEALDVVVRYGLAATGWLLRELPVASIKASNGKGSH
jgi:hypothetical protein